MILHLSLVPLYPWIILFATIGVMFILWVYLDEKRNKK